MMHTRFVTAMILAALVSVTACNDSTSPKPQPSSVAPSPVAFVTLYGVIHRTGRDPQHGLTLTLEDGSEVSLSFSAETSGLTSVDGAEVEVRGSWGADTSLEVNDFTVRRVNGDAVIDGTLLEMRTQELEDNTLLGYAMQLKDASIVWLTDPSPDMLNHIGARMWVDRSDDGRAIAFGVISE